MRMRFNDLQTRTYQIRSHGPSAPVYAGACRVAAVGRLGVGKAKRT